VKILRALAITLAAAVLGLAALYFAMAERVEVVVLHSHGADGEHETRLWVIDHDGAAWLRTSAANATWLPRIRANPAIELGRGEETHAFTATVSAEPATVAHLNELTLEKYGWSERLLRSMGADSAGQVGIRLDPR
jgi:general stress protein 26